MAVQIIINMDDQGQVNVSGPLQNKILCFGLLEVARQTIEEFENKPNVVVPKIVPPFMKGN